MEENNLNKEIEIVKPYVDYPFEDIVCNYCEHTLCLRDVKVEGNYIPKFCANCGREICWKDFNGFD